MGQESVPGSRRQHRLEVWAALLLSLATVGSAWSAYQASVWGGIQTAHYSQANAARIKATAASTQGNQERIADLITFLQWASAYTGKDEVLAQFLFERFRPEFKKAVDAWVATRPLKNPDAPATPFLMPEYRLLSKEEEAQLTAQADGQMASAEKANHQSDSYVLLTVILASVLFFCGISTTFKSLPIRVLTNAVGTAFFLVASAFLAIYPKAF